MYPRLKVREALELFRTFFLGETHSSDKLIGMMNLEEKAGTLTQDLSGGQRQRLSVGLALVNIGENRRACGFHGRRLSITNRRIQS